MRLAEGRPQPRALLLALHVAAPRLMSQTACTHKGCAESVSGQHCARVARARCDCLYSRDWGRRRSPMLGGEPGEDASEQRGASQQPCLVRWRCITALSVFPLLTHARSTTRAARGVHTAAPRGRQRGGRDKARRVVCQGGRIDAFQIAQVGRAAGRLCTLHAPHSFGTTGYLHPSAPLLPGATAFSAERKSSTTARRTTGFPRSAR